MYSCLSPTSKYWNQTINYIKKNYVPHKDNPCSIKRNNENY